ncbi:hypothetical protein BJ546DRAFT_977148 [Cryomyces antarcticus]
MGDVTPPPLQGPSAKEKKYDRQLRLWAASGQAALEDAHILLINSGPGVVGVEALKNLVLPGIGQFTILDSSVVAEEDLGVNFFLDESCLGGFRAEHCCNLLKELNPDVQGNFVTEPLQSFITKSNALQPFTLILVTSPVVPEILDTISVYAQQHAIPAFYIHSVGFYSHFSLLLPPAFPIVETHPDPETTTNLQLLTPWPALSELAEEKTHGLDSMIDEDHGHVPYVLLLLYYLERWKASHNGLVPQSYSEKTAFRDLVRSGERTKTAEGGEENFDEAAKAVLKTLNPPAPSSSVKEVFRAEECQNLTRDSANFWVIAHAISAFHQTHSVLPLPGAVPDMKARSKDYIELQNVYKSKAREDVAEVLATVRSLEKELGRSILIDEKEVEAFCKGAGYIKLVRGRPFHTARPNEMVKWGDRARFAAGALENPDSLILLYIAFLAYDSFLASHPIDALGGAQKVPGLDAAEPDTQKMIGIAEAIIDSLLNEASRFIEDPEYSEIKHVSAKFVEEIVRAGGSELHNIAALTGGMVAQEVIKVITKQYIPVDNTCLFDGIASKTSVLRL